MQAEVLFKTYKQMKKEHNLLKWQLSQFQGIAEDDLIDTMSLSRTVSGERHHATRSSDQTAKTALNYQQVLIQENEAWHTFLAKSYRELDEEIQFFEQSISQLEGKLPEIVRDLLEGELTWEDMMSKYNVSRAMIGKYRKAALQALDETYALRDQQIATYLLG